MQANLHTNCKKVLFDIPRIQNDAESRRKAAKKTTKTQQKAAHIRFAIILRTSTVANTSAIALCALSCEMLNARLNASRPQ